MFRLIAASLLLLASTDGFSQTPKNESCESETLGVEKAFPNLPALASPLDMIQPKSDSSVMFVALRDGQIVSFDNASETGQYAIALDIRAKVKNEVEMGLTGIAFHPDYPKDNRLFAIYSDLTHENRTTLASFAVDVNSNVIDPNSEKVILTLKKNALFHVAGNVIFGPDGYLYAGFGDDGFTPWFAKDKKNLHGSIIRIDIDKEPYAIPKDNPFNEGQDLCREGENKQACPEIFAYGLRNPWRFNFDEKTKILWEGDVGEDSFEEINIIEAGKNYGWPTMEGPECFDAWFCLSWGLTDPVNGYDQPEGVGQSIIGGYVYRGSRIKSLYGKYVFGDIYSHNYFAIDASSPENQELESLFNAGFIAASMAQDNDGELYLLKFDGTDKGDHIYKIESSCR